MIQKTYPTGTRRHICARKCQIKLANSKPDCLPELSASCLAAGVYGADTSPQTLSFVWSAFLLSDRWDRESVFVKVLILVFGYRMWWVSEAKMNVHTQSCYSRQYTASWKWERSTDENGTCSRCNIRNQFKQLILERYDHTSFDYKDQHSKEKISKELDSNSARIAWLHRSTHSDQHRVNIGQIAASAFRLNEHLSPSHFNIIAVIHQ